jgi:hypothetical protein
MNESTEQRRLAFSDVEQNQEPEKGIVADMIVRGM